MSKSIEEICLEAQRNTKRALDLLEKSRSVPIPPIYTVGGHGYEDDDDEDFWCPVCHDWLGDHRNYERKCPCCAQTIADFYTEYTWDDMMRTRWLNDENTL